jgi:hypothetical protein
MAGCPQDREQRPEKRALPERKESVGSNTAQRKIKASK